MSTLPLWLSIFFFTIPPVMGVALCWLGCLRSEAPLNRVLSWGLGLALLACWVMIVVGYVQNGGF